MTTSTHRANLCAGLLTIGLFTAIAAPVLAQNSNPSPGTTTTTNETRIAIVKGHNVYVRSGAAESYYPFAKLNDGDLVKVTGSKFEWSRIAPIGPAFDGSFGYIKFAKSDTTRFRVSADGKSGVTLGKFDVIAPNLESKLSAKDSWKSLVKLDADQTLQILEKTETDKDTIYKVELPESAYGWVSTAFLENASPEQAAQWDTNLANYAKAKAEGAKASASKSATPTKTTTPETPTTETAANTTPNSTQPTTPPVVATLPDPAFVPVTNETAPITEAANNAGMPATTPIAAAPAENPENRLPKWEDLEGALKKLQREPIESAEVTPLRDMYLDLADRSRSNERVARYSKGRAEQLQVWADLQKKRQEVDALRQRARMTAEEAVAVQKALESSAEYVAVGRVAASTIYDGENLPKLLRLQDAANGRTIAYLQPDEEYQIVNLIGNLVGIVGEKQYDGSLRLNIVHPTRIDLLMPEERTANVPTDR